MAVSVLVSASEFDGELVEVALVEVTKPPFDLKEAGLSPSATAALLGQVADELRTVVSVEDAQVIHLEFIVDGQSVLEQDWVRDGTEAAEDLELDGESVSAISQEDGFNYGLYWLCNEAELHPAAVM